MVVVVVLDGCRIAAIWMRDRSWRENRSGFAVGWLMGWLMGWLLGWLMGWLVGWFGWFGLVGLVGGMIEGLRELPETNRSKSSWLKV